jgi:hypothetical protein
MQTNNYLNVVGTGSGASAGASSGSSGGGGLGSWSALIEVAINFGVSYLTAKSEGRKNEAFLRKMSELDTAQAEKLKKIISESATENAKTKAIIDFLNQEDIKKLEEERKRKKTFLLIGLGFTVVLLGIVFYKLNKQNG